MLILISIHIFQINTFAGPFYRLVSSLLVLRYRFEGLISGMLHCYVRIRWICYLYPQRTQMMVLITRVAYCTARLCLSSFVTKAYTVVFLVKCQNMKYQILFKARTCWTKKCCVNWKRGINREQGDCWSIWRVLIMKELRRLKQCLECLTSM